MLYYLNIQAISSCPDYPITNYSLFLEDSGKKRIAQIVSASGSVISFSVDGLMENRRYVYYVTGTNQYGASNRSPVVAICESYFQYLR